MKNISTLITKWILEDKLNDQSLGSKIRKFYWKFLHPKEHWVWEDDEEEVSGYGYGESSDDGGDEIY